MGAWWEWLLPFLSVALAFGYCWANAGSTPLSSVWLFEVLERRFMLEVISTLSAELFLCLFSLQTQSRKDDTSHNTAITISPLCSSSCLEHFLRMQSLNWFRKKSLESKQQHSGHLRKQCLCKVKQQGTDPGILPCRKDGGTRFLTFLQLSKTCSVRQKTWTATHCCLQMWPMDNAGR